MPRASWKGFLRLSLVSCPVTLSPAATRTKSVRLHQVWQPNAVWQHNPQRIVPLDEQQEDEQPARAAVRHRNEDIAADPPEAPSPTRIVLHPHDPHTGEEIERTEVVKGYEYERGRFVTFSADELKALDVESSKIIDLETFVPRAEVDPIYLDTPYYLYPEGTVAAETLMVIGAAMAEGGAVALGRVTLSRRERLVMIEPRGGGMAAIMLRSQEEIRAPAFPKVDTEIDPEMVAVAATIIKRRSGHFDPAMFRDRYQEALRALVAAKMRGLPIKAREVPAPPPVHDLMTALKRSLAKENPKPTKSRRIAAEDRRQPSLLLPVSGKNSPAAATAPSRRRKA